MNNSHLDDPAYWRKRATEIRDLAGQVSASYVKQELERIAADYDRLAERAGQRAGNQRRR